MPPVVKPLLKHKPIPSPIKAAPTKVLVNGSLTNFTTGINAKAMTLKITANPE